MHLVEVDQREQARAGHGQLAQRRAGRVETLAASGGATEQDLDKVQSEAQALRRQLGTLGASANASERAADAVSEGVHAAELQVAVAEAQVEMATRQIAVAEAAATRAQVAVGECTLVAPRDGIVEVRAFEPGELAVPGSDGEHGKQYPVEKGGGACRSAEASARRWRMPPGRAPVKVLRRSVRPASASARSMRCFFSRP